jgi:lysophospholipase L1-like esterase
VYLLDRVKKAIIKIEYNLKQRYWENAPPKNYEEWFNNPNNKVISKWWKPGIPNIDDVGHGETNPKSTKLKWYGMDNKSNFKDHNAEHTWTEDNVNYTFNSYGYRGDEPVCDGELNVLVCGDSHTFGVGLDDHQVWTEQLRKLLRKKYDKVKIINVSCPGASNDYIARTLFCTLNTIKPDVVIAQYTYPNRREAIWESGYLWELNTTIPDNKNQDEYEEFQSWFMTINDHTDAYNMTKNHNLIQQLCNNLKISYFVWHANHLLQFQRQYDSQNNFFYKNDRGDLARDGNHFGPRTHSIFAKKVYKALKETSTYGSKLDVL